MITVQAMTRFYSGLHGRVTALAGIDLHIEQGRFIVLRGPSGSGKTTLLLSIAGMLHPTSGRVLYDGRDLYAMSRGRRARLRARQIGFVFQTFHLIPYLSVSDNVALAGRAAGSGPGREYQDSLLSNLGLADRRSHRPAQLSSGERQRTALARALANRPRLLLADEPTGNLDPDHARRVLDHLDEFRRGGGTVVLVTHLPDADPYADQVLHLVSGRLQP